MLGAYAWVSLFEEGQHLMLPENVINFPLPIGEAVIKQLIDSGRMPYGHKIG